MNRLSILICLFAFTWAACKTDKNDATVSLRMTDGPADFDAIIVHITGAEFHLSDDTSSADGWYDLPVTDGFYNLLALANGNDTLIGQGTLPVGLVSQIRLHLGTGNTIMVDSVWHDLDVVANNNLKLNLHQLLEPGQSHTILLDFDAGKSIVETGNGSFKLKPVIRAIDGSTSGAVRGYVDPASCKAFLTASDGAADFSTYTHRPTGYFFIGGLPAGNYTLSIVTKPPCSDTILTNIPVVVGQVTDLGNIGL